MHKDGLHRVAMSVCLSVRHVCVFCTFKNFSRSHSHPIVVFHTKRHGNIPKREPPNRGFEYRWEAKIVIIYQYLAASRVVNGPTAKCCTHSCAGPWQVVGDTRRCYQQAASFADGGRRQRSVYDKKSQHYTKDNRRALNCTQ